MRYLLAVRIDDRTEFLEFRKSGTLTPHKAHALIFQSRSNAEETRDKIHRKWKRVGIKTKLRLFPIRDQDPNDASAIAGGSNNQE